MGHQIRPAPAAFSPACIPASLSRDPSRGRALGGAARSPGSPGAAGRPARDGPGTLCRCGHHGRQRRLQGPWASPSCSGHNVPMSPQPHKDEEAAGAALGALWEQSGAVCASGMFPALVPAQLWPHPAGLEALGLRGRLEPAQVCWTWRRTPGMAPEQVRKDMPGHHKAVKQAGGSSLCCHPSPPSTGATSDVPLWSELNPTPLVKLCRRAPGTAAS